MIKEISLLIQDLYKTRKALNKVAPHWDFTLDGNLVGDIGEALACHHFGLTPLEKGAKTHDAKTKDGKLVQIKTTQKDVVGLGIEKQIFEHLIVVKLEEDGSYGFIYNGPGNIVLENTKSNSISIKRLKNLQKLIGWEQQIQIIIGYIE